MSDKDKNPYLHGLYGGLAPPTEGGTEEYMQWRMGKDQHDRGVKAWSRGGQESPAVSSDSQSSIVYLVLLIAIGVAGFFLWNMPSDEEKQAAWEEQAERIFTDEQLAAGFVEPAQSEIDYLYGCVSSPATVYKGPGMSFETVTTLETATTVSMLFGPQGDLSSEGSPWLFLLSPQFGYISGLSISLEGTGSPYC